MKHKRILAMLLAVASCLSLAVSASAASTARKATDFKDFAATMNIVCTDHRAHIRHRPVGNLASVGEYGQIRFGIRIVVQFQRTGNDRHSLLP